VRKLECRVATLFDEGPIDQQVVNDAEHRDRRYAQGETDRSGALDDLGLLDHLLGDRIATL
jgi:hypothetical protein